MTTLRKERISMVFSLLESAYQDNPPTEEARNYNLEVAERIVDKTFSRSEQKIPVESNGDLFRGDWRIYPEHLHEIAKCLRDTWMFVLPDKPKGKKKGSYGMYISAMESIKQSCGEFGIKALVETHKKWKDGFKDVIAPYTVAQPTSLVNVTAGTARELRESATQVGQSGRVLKVLGDR